MEVMSHASTFLLPPAAGSPAGSGGKVAAAAVTTDALVVLNQPLPRFAPIVWSHANLRVFADGGANRVYDGMPKLFPNQDPLEVRRRYLADAYRELVIEALAPYDDFQRYKPDVIEGDMDSIRPEVKEFYVSLGVKIVDESHDQDTTDLHKCITYICNCFPGPDKLSLRVLVAGALGGRFDHMAGNINVLYSFPHVRVVLLSDDCLIFLLPMTHNHEIHINSAIEGPHCGLVPIGAPAKCTTTTGLKWNLSNTEMSFGGLISACNIAIEEIITVQSDSHLLWTISLKKDLQDL